MFSLSVPISHPKYTSHFITLGESILLCRETERSKVEQLIGSDLEPVSSCLIQGNGETLCSSMKRAILEVRTCMALITVNLELLSVQNFTWERGP